MKKRISFATAGVLIAAQLSIPVFAADTAVNKDLLPTSQFISAPIDKNTINLKVGEDTDITQNEGGFAGVFWKYSIRDSSVVSLKSENTIPPKHGVADGFSKHTWTFIANKAGTTKIVFTSRFETETYIINVSDATPAKNIIRLKVGDKTTISKKYGGLAGGKYDIDILNKKVIDITDTKVIPPPRGVYDAPITKVWTLTAKKIGLTKIIVKGSGFHTGKGNSVEEYIVVVTKK